MVTSLSGEYIPAHLSETRPEPALFNDGHKEELPEAVQNEQTVKLSISDSAKSLLTQLQGEFLPAQSTERSSYNKTSLKKQSKKTASGTARDGEKTAASKELSEEEKEQIRELQERDAEVRAHEQKHIAAAGAYTRGGPVYEYQTGPDGRMYAIGGEVELDTSMPKDPDAALAKARTLRSSATATGEPSSADLSIASYANQMEADARAEKAQKTEEQPQKRDSNSSSSPLEAYKKAIQEDTVGIYINFSA